MRDEVEETSKKKRSKSKSKKLKGVKTPSMNLAFIKDERTHKIVGGFFMLFSIFLLFAFSSYIYNWFSWQTDDIFSNIGFSRVLFDNTIEVNNFMGRLGAALSLFFIKNGFGIISYVFVYLLFLVGFRLFFGFSLLSFSKALKHSLFGLVWVSFTLGFLFRGAKASLLGGVFGYELSTWSIGFVGNIGTFILLFFGLVSFLVLAFNIHNRFVNNSIEEEHDAEKEDALNSYSTEGLNIDDLAALEGLNDDVKEDSSLELTLVDTPESEGEEPKLDLEIELTENDDGNKAVDLDAEIPTQDQIVDNDEGELELNIEQVEDEGEVTENIPEDGHGIETEYDPTADLSNFKNPSLDLLADHGSSNEISMTKEELEDNKNKIVKTLGDYSIKIQSIKATIGPTVTLYEIIPAAGVRISKIKNLEDDIALSLAAMGIRIIAPIPGRGTIGIEVPNLNPEIVSMKTILASEKFQNSKFDLPVGIGKTISNQTYVFDLAKMPHLLMAGATGQGKSVGLNAVITSLLYKKHPAQLKFVMVDPKKVELSLFSKIERHYLAKLPDKSEAIITDVKEVVNTLNSLCIEMDERYDLLKIAHARNLKEYNVKFIARKLNPQNGHRFLPYIVVIVDEFADLIMTAGKEIEAPIARLAQLARAIGIHLVIATQRPSVNVITGLIKANFPARIAFRVASKIDSRTILDAGGADQLIGRGDMLMSTGNEMVRLQCAFVDTPEVEQIVDYIGEQQGYASAFNLPEFVGDEDGGKSDVDLSDRDVLFEDAARMIVQNQSGSTSMIQRKLKLGYNRAGRIIDQLEAAGIVGPFEGSKAREVLIKDIVYLEQFLEDLNKPK
ncbi:MAG: DNA translocase FtsK [Bacteroidales bacterium]|nr:DNA translocase FtsK [Bacteroidales bacterium]